MGLHAEKRAPPGVVAGFGLGGRPARPLPGGAGMALLVGDVVVKPVHDVPSAVLAQRLAALAEVPDGLRLAEPIATVDGAWESDGWVANRFVAGLRTLEDEPGRIVEAGRQLSVALTAVSPADRSAITGRGDRWAVADRFVWGDRGNAGDRVDLGPAASAVVAELRRHLTDRDEPSAVVHGDLAGNVFVDPDGDVVVLDLSLFLRPRRYGSAIVVADNLLWRDGGPELYDLIGRDEDGLARALLFRLVAEQLASNPRHGADLADYRRVIDLLGW